MLFDVGSVVSPEKRFQSKGGDKMEIVSYPDEQFLPPTVYRQPPDGHEFPPNYIEPSISETRLEDSGVFLEDAVRLPSQQYSVYPAEFHDGKPGNNPEEKSLAALDELIHGKCCHITSQDATMISEDSNEVKKTAENQQEDPSKDSEEPAKPVENKTGMLTPNESAISVESKSETPKAKEADVHMEMPKNSHVKLAGDQKPMQLNAGERNITSQSPSISSRWKSEENLRQDRLPSRSARNSEVQVSVKERIAMFSRSGSEVSLNNPTKKSLNKEDKSLLRSEKKTESKPHVQEFTLKDSKWYSTGNISTTGSKMDIISNGTIKEASSLTSVSSEANNEQSKRTEITSSYPETQWSRYQRYNYSYSSYPRKLEDSYKRYSTSSLFSSIDKRQSKLKGLVIPEKPASYSKISKSLPTIVSCSSVLLNKIEVPKMLHANTETRTEQNNRLPITESKENDTKDINKHSVNPLSELPWNQKSSTLPKYSPAFKHRALNLPRTTTVSSISPTPPSSLTSPLSPPPSSPSSICSSSSSSLQKQDVFHLLADNISETNGQSNAHAPIRSQASTSGRYLAQPVSLSEPKTIYESPIVNKENDRTSKSEDWSAVTGWATCGERDDDSMSSASQQTEDSRNLADDSMSETNSDSEFRPRYLSHQRTVLRTTMDSTDSVRNFRALAEKWESRSGDSSDALSPPPAVSPVHTLKRENGRRNSQENTKLPPSLKPRSPELIQSTVKLREEKVATLRPQSLVDSPRYAGGLKKLELTESCESLNRLQTNGREPLQRRSLIGNASRSLSVSDICKSFESSAIQQNGIKSNGHRVSSLYTDNERLKVDHSRMSSVDSTCSELSIPEQDSSQMIVILRKQQVTGSVGITLAGGADCEVKDITIHKIIPGSLADRDGRLRKGQKILMVNGQHVKGLTHREVQSLLKVPCTEVEIVVSQGSKDSCDTQRDQKYYIEAITTSNKTDLDPKNGKLVSVDLVKEGTGLGFGIEGGKDSPLGDRPLLIKRLFKGGAADRDGRLKVGDELLSVNGQSVGNMTRTEAWNYMKKLPDGIVTLIVQAS